MKVIRVAHGSFGAPEDWFLSYHYESWDFHCYEMEDLIREVANPIALIKAALNEKVNDIAMAVEEAERLLAKYNEGD